MSKLYITEYARMKRIEGFGNGQIPDDDSIITTQVIDYAGGHAESATLNAATVVVRIHTDAICALAYGTAPTAVSGTNERWAANQTEYRGVTSGKKYSAVITT